MTAQEFDRTLVAVLTRRPFRPFAVELRDGRRVEVDAQNSVALRAGTAAYIGPGGVPAWFDHKCVSQVIESDPGASA